MSYHKNISGVLKVLQMIMALWTVIFATYHLLLFLLAAGPTDFNGNPNGLDEYVVAALLLITGILQLMMVPKLVKESSGKIILVLLGSVFVPWIAGLIFYGRLNSLFVPLIYAVPLIVLYGGYWFVSRANSVHKREFL